MKHPFVSIGSSRKKITTVPDYLFEVDGQYAWILEAKGPSENILDSPHVEQAYSYAIHSEVRVPIFGLCNGRELVLFIISNPKPIFHVPIQEIGHAWPEIEKRIKPENVTKQEFKLCKDFGLHIKRLGLGEVKQHVFFDIPIPSIGLSLEDAKYRFSTTIALGPDDRYLASFDFGRDMLTQLTGKIPESALDALEKIGPEGSNKLVFRDALLYLSVRCRLGNDIDMEENDNEIFLPLNVTEFL
mgnify:CR=1 FL=1